MMTDLEKIFADAQASKSRMHCDEPIHLPSDAETGALPHSPGLPPHEPAMTYAQKLQAEFDAAKARRDAKLRAEVLADADIVLHEVKQLEEWLDERGAPRSENGVVLSLQGSRDGPPRNQQLRPR